ncbi:MAG: hypothetical protein DRH21_02160 [Deltaproteobacteria bacterium]|nr:MAG: hypothetical protein DRH21_02160 [Deltaproteobacteria bacterium]
MRDGLAHQNVKLFLSEPLVGDGISIISQGRPQDAPRCPLTKCIYHRYLFLMDEIDIFCECLGFEVSRPFIRGPSGISSYRISTNGLTAHVQIFENTNYERQ